MTHPTDATSEVVALTRRLVAIPSVSRDSNEAVSDVLEEVLTGHGFETERLTYRDENGVLKVSLVAKRGAGRGGLGFFSHSDVVPADATWQPFEPVVTDGKLYGRGSCDMKGPLAATVLAAASVDVDKLKKPVYIVVTADEENGFGGAKQLPGSRLFREHGWPDLGVVAEPTELQPVYAHKGGYHVFVTAHGVAAHTSTDKGVSANFLIAPFLAEMAELRDVFMTDPHFQDPEFDPPTNGFNLTLDDNDCAKNVTAAQTVATLIFRAMPRGNAVEVVEIITKKAQAYGFEVTHSGYDAFYTPQDAPVVKLALQATGATQAVTVPYGTDALVLHEHLPLVMLGPGSIQQAHTVDEFVEVAQLERAQAIYTKMLETYCT